MDDSTIVYRPEDRSRAQQFKEDLKAQIQIKELGALSWFLGIRVKRNREAHKAWLCQDTYIENVATRYGLT